MDYQELLLSVRLLPQVDQTKLLNELMGTSQEEYLSVRKEQRIHPTNYTSISLKFWGSRVSIWFIFTLSMFFRANINHSVGLTLCFLHIPKNV